MLIAAALTGGLGTLSEVGRQQDSVKWSRAGGGVEILGSEHI